MLLISDNIFDKIQLREMEVFFFFFFKEHKGIIPTFVHEASYIRERCVHVRQYVAAHLFQALKILFKTKAIYDERGK